MRKFYLLPLFIAFSCVVPLKVLGQQNRQNYNLLWKISGNGLQKPSYLFGTMHLKDKRVFEFSDSVLVKLDECPAFAMEVLPDSILKEVFSMYLPGRADTTDKLSQMLTPEEYALLDKRLQEEAGMPISKLRSKEPWVINMLLDKPVVVPRKGDKAAFLDAYFYRLARQQQKKLIGLEKMEEQTSLKNDYGSLKDQLTQIKTQLDKSYESKFLEDLIKLYWTGDINKLYTTLYKSGMSESYRHRALTLRNQTMVDRVTRYMHDEQTFIAVGAAHLPGQDGMIKLLQQKGYLVTPVKATFTGMAARYKEKAAHERWSTFTSEEYAYAVDMPSDPFPVELPGPKSAKPMVLYTYPDLASGMVYYSTGMFLPNQINPAQQEELLKRVGEGMAENKNSKILSEKKISFDGHPGRELEIYDGKEGVYMRSRIYLRKNTMYMLVAGGNKEQLNSKESARFLDSFRLQNFAPASWKDFTEAEGAFRLKTPVALTRQTREQDVENMPGIKSFQTIYSGIDNQKSIAYTVLYNDFTAGFVILEDSVYFSNVLKLVAQNTKGTITELRDISLQAYPGKAYSIVSKDIYYYCRVFLRGSRVYYLIVTTPAASAGEASKAEAEAFMGSFAFTDFKKPQWKAYTAANGAFTVQMPGKVMVEEDSSDTFLGQIQSTVWTSGDAYSRLSYLVIRSRYSAYFQAENEKAYFKQLVEASVEEKDTLLSESVIAVNGMPGREILVQTRGNHTLRRTRMVLRGGELYQLLMYIPQSWTDEKAIDSFFDSFQFARQPVKGDLFSLKTDKILGDLYAKDTLVQQKAREAVSRHTFTTRDLPALYQAVGKSYRDDEAEYSSTRLLLLNALSRVYDNTTAGFIKTLYPALPDEHPEWQLAALQVLTAINSQESLHLLAELITSKAPRARHEQGLFYRLADSLDNSKVMFPRIMALQKLPEYDNSLYWLMNQMYSKGILTKADLTQYHQPLLSDARAKLTVYLQSKKDSEAFVNDTYSLQLLAKLLACFPEDKESVALLTQMIASSSDDLALSAGMLLLKNNQPVDKKRVGAIAANRSLRLPLYHELTSLKRTQLFPKKYLTQEYFAEASLVAYLLDEEGDEPDKIVLLGTKEAMYQGKKGRVYIYKFMYKGEEGTKDNWYVAISGMQPLNKEAVSAAGERTYTTWSLLEEKSLEEHYQELMQATEAVY